MTESHLPPIGKDATGFPSGRQLPYRASLGYTDSTETVVPTTSNAYLVNTEQNLAI